jgi:hypothetical protein
MNSLNHAISQLSTVEQNAEIEESIQASARKSLQDANSLVFAAANNLKRIDLASGQSYVIGDVRMPPNRLRTSWAPNGTILFNNSQTGPLRRISASGGAPAAATLLGATTGAFAQTSP